ncbi:MAG: hypothetical protein ACTHU0_13725 [Kofleriaceae bacterium]
MRFVLVLVFAACGGRGSSPKIEPTRPAVAASTTEFLLANAATDFRAHDPAAGFREVRVGSVTAAGGTIFVLCGEFLPAQPGGHAAWTPFVTVKTSGYEQYIGAQAAAWCQAPKFKGSDEDLSSSLMRRFDSSR